jgi:hypothetical protein
MVTRNEGVLHLVPDDVTSWMLPAVLPCVLLMLTAFRYRVAERLIRSSSEQLERLLIATSTASIPYFFMNNLLFKPTIFTCAGRCLI